MNINSLSESDLFDLKIGGWVGVNCNTIGLDSEQHCFDKKFFKNYPHRVVYSFNELGFRERPVKQYTTDPILVIGDSFTLGLGLPFELTYPQQLEKLTDSQVLNFSLNGASNNWINRKLSILLKYFSPKAIVVHYTFSHRRENLRTDWFDDERTNQYDKTTVEQDFNNWLVNHTNIKQLVKSIPTVYSCIPNWHLDIDYDKHPELIKPVVPIDYARDHFHYGELTSKTLAESLAKSITGASDPYFSNVSQAKSNQ
jgi:hypothetical protein